MYINKVVWAGHIGFDAKSFPPTTPTGKYMITFSVAQTKAIRRSDNTYQDKTTWLDFQGHYTPERHAQLLPKLVKGAHVYLEGELEIEKKQIDNVDRSFTKVILKEIQFLPKAMRSTDPAPSESPARTPSAEEKNPEAFAPAKF